MAKYIIEGGKALKGTVRISGNKNSVLPCMAATLLTSEEITLTNVPDISDVSVFLDILKTLGTESKRDGGSVSLKTPKIKSHKIPTELTDGTPPHNILLILANPDSSNISLMPDNSLILCNSSSTVLNLFIFLKLFKII